MSVQAVEAAPLELRLATTTSTQDSGLLDYLIPIFEKSSGLKVSVISVGTGQALKLGEDRDVDVLLVHSRPDEDKFMKAGFGISRRDVMYNDFIICGPANDPLRLRAAGGLLGAFDRLSRGQWKFVSRGDDSGTAKFEKRTWLTIGKPPSGSWYLDVGGGQAEALRMAEQLQAYVLTDRSSFSMLRSRLTLEVMVENDPLMQNRYGVIVVDPKGSPLNLAGANAFSEWITSPAGQLAISKYRISGQQAFFPSYQAQ